MVHNKFDPIIIDLPEGFPITTNTGLHGDMQFFEVSDEHSMTVCAPFIDRDMVSYTYACRDSDEGEVTISYQTICGSAADSPDVEGWDVRIACGSDVWGLTESGTAVRDAIYLHKALGRDKPNRE